MTKPPNRKRQGKLKIDAPFDEALRAALEVKPAEKPPKKPRKRRASEDGDPKTRNS